MRGRDSDASFSLGHDAEHCTAVEVAIRLDFRALQEEKMAFELKWESNSKVPFDLKAPILV